MKRRVALLALSLCAGLPLARAAAVPTLKVPQGKLIGLRKSGVEQFLGVPFAAPPVGPLRWQPPQPPVWKGQRQATKFGPVCAQGGSGSEDCLTLNIYRPPNAKNAPLVVWVHGGFFTGGDASLFDGSVLARDYGVVVATVNYRLGPFGFLAVPGVGDGNYGLMDIQEAVRWLRRHAGALGANPDNVTLAGQSAGAAAICTLMVAPNAQKLFHKAILQSGSCASDVFTTPLSQARRAGQQFAQALRCTGADVAACMRGKTQAEISAVRVPGRSVIDPVPLPPVHGDAFVPLPPLTALRDGWAAPVPTLLGINREEGQIFEPYLPAALRGSRLVYGAALALYDPRHALTMARQYAPRPDETPIRALTRLLTDRVFACPTSWLAAQLAPRQATYFYEFSDPRPPLSLPGIKDAPALGAYHGAELAYVLETPVVGLSNPAQFTPAQTKLARQMGEYWTNFARSGQPAALGLTVWPPVKLPFPRVMTLEPGASSLQPNFDGRHQCGFWDALDGRPADGEARAVFSQVP